MNKSGFFKPHKDGFAAIAPELIRAMVANSSDFAVVLSPDLRVIGLHRGVDTLDSDDLDQLVGMPFQDSLTVESHGKFAAMVEGARRGDAPRWRQLNHEADRIGDLPVSYAAIADEEGQIILLGRDKRELSALQQRLIQAQMTIEQDYERIRQAESRYRVLFETGTDALMILSAETSKILDANSAATHLLDREASDLTNRSFTGLVEPRSVAGLKDALDTIRTKGGETSASVHLKPDGRLVWIDVLLFRSVSDTLLLCRLRSQDSGSEEGHPIGDALMDLYQRAGDAIVFTDKSGTILRSNAAFQALTSIAVAEQLRDQSLADFLGRPSVDLDVMTANAERTGRLSIYATSVRSQFGQQVPVEISTTYLPDQRPPGFGFVIRDVTRLEASRQSGSAMTTEAVEHVIDLVGSTPLKELVRSTTDVVEKLCIETALRLTNNNRAAAAEMLGLSRQSLYVKLRRFGLIDSDVDAS
ncbi:transcriptional regulator PpsR [Oceanibium sediminis]|uniref:transcriptional regulator PpsR n=1 Tax=Oceanibium sediminis TaxID=2026339 RepID=UPI000DD3F8F3|nr:transcriptional regulator PpsR [Oceanibium sediminis]